MSCEKCDSCQELNTKESIAPQFDDQHKRVRNLLKYFKMSDCNPLLYRLLYQLACTDAQFATAIEYLDKKIGNNDLEARVKALQTAVTALQTNTKIDDANTLITAMSADIEALRQQVYDALDRIYTLEHTDVCVPNKFNLMANSTWNLGSADWNMSTDSTFEVLDPEEDKPNSHIYHAKPNTSSTQQNYQKPAYIYVEQGKEYTIAFDFRELNFTVPLNAFIALRVVATPDTQATAANSLWQQYIGHKALNLDGAVESWTRFIFTFIPASAGWLAPIVYDADSTGNHESFWRELMIIEGGECAMPDKWYPRTLNETNGDVKVDWNAPEGSAGELLNKPFKTIGANLSVDNDGVLSAVGGGGEGGTLYPSTGQNTDGAMTQKATTDELAKKLTKKDADATYLKVADKLPLYHAVGEEDDGAITPAAVKNELQTGYPKLANNNIFTGNNTFNGSTTLANPKEPKDTNGWIKFDERKNGFTGGGCYYKVHMGVCTLLMDYCTTPAVPNYGSKEIFTLPAAIQNGKNMRFHTEVSNVGMSGHIDSAGKVMIVASPAITAGMHVSFTITYVL